VIREATPADARRIAEIHVRAWRFAYKGQMPEQLLAGRTVEGRLEMWNRGLARRGQGETFPRIWVFEREGQVIGFVSSGPSQDPDATSETGEVYAIYIEPDAIGTGVGRVLFSHGVDDLKELGFERATLWVLESNELGRRFYEAAGWLPDGTEKLEDWDGFGIPEVRYCIAFRQPASTES